MPGKEHSFDAIVIGSGMSGGWAAKELTEKGFKTLVLERGRDVRHIVDYPTANMFPYEFEHRGEIPLDIKKSNPIINRCYLCCSSVWYPGGRRINWCLGGATTLER